ncbi:MAG: PEP/pyruvate-binding domain-containing protein [Smithellaceae bacterium]
MAIKSKPVEKNDQWVSSALKVNLERTATDVQIPPQYAPLLQIVKDHYGLQKKTRELLIELNHPYVNWDYVLKELKTISIGDFYIYNNHSEGLTALSILLTIYFDVLKSSASADVKDSAIHYLFDYTDAIITQSNEFLERNLPLFPGFIDSLIEMADGDSALFKKCSSYLKRIIRAVAEKNVNLSTPVFDTLLYKMFRATYSFWLTQPDPALWLITGRGTGATLDEKTYLELVEPLSHQRFRKLIMEVEALRPRDGEKAGAHIGDFLSMPDYFQIIDGYLLVADQLEKSKDYQGCHLIKLDFLFGVMSVPGLRDIHTSAMREINYSLKLVFQEEKKENLDDFVRRIFTFLKKNTSQNEFRGASIDCIITAAREVFAQNAHPLVETFIDELISYGFEYPEIQGSTTEWQVQVNPEHIRTIRAWLEIIAMKPRWTKRLISALIINLKIGGIFIRDTDLIQRDISRLLNADIAPAYNLIKQLLRIFPVYFSEIGAEGELRDITTRVDELSFRSDRLIDFFRKQSHVESNSLLVDFIEDIFRYWFSGEKRFIRKHIPAEVFDQVINSGIYFDGMHQAFVYLFSKTGNNPRKFLEWETARIAREIQQIKDISEVDQERVSLMIRIYQLIHKKYYPQYFDLLKDLESVNAFAGQDIQSLKRALKAKNHFRSLTIILKFLSVLKARVLSEKKTQSFENIYHKRHIAAGIPSMYGTYHEEKFDAMGITLRLESLGGMLFEELIQSLNLKFITKRTIVKIHTYLWHYLSALELEGISTEGLVAKVKYITSALPIKQFSVEQYLDIFRFISKGIQDVIRDYYIDAHSVSLPVIVRQIKLPLPDAGVTAEQPRYDELVYQHSENFIRGMISSAFGVQVLDNFVHAVIKTLNAELEKFKDNKRILDLLMSYNPELAVSSIYGKNAMIDNQILLGNKGYFLKKLVSFGFPVPPGFIITTEVFRGYDAVYGYKYIFRDLADRINRELAALERKTGRKFGDRNNPLLLSVRSGATVSLPGMMRSFLNVGINATIAENLSGRKDFQWAAWDSYRRFLQTWGMFQGLSRDFFDAIMDGFKQKHGVERKIQFPPDLMKTIAQAYKKGILDSGIPLADDPMRQLRHAILQVFDSWYSEQAKIYRHQMHLSDEWGTAVILQAMVFGNLNERSGSGVIFTRDPKSVSSDVTLYGDFIFGVQGDDIVSGLVETFPISEKQRITEHRHTDISLEVTFPHIYDELVKIAEIMIYEKGFNHQELEFTFEGPQKEQLYLLQTRDMDQVKSKTLRRFKDSPSLASSLLGTGIGVSGGALCGRAVYSEEDIKRFREKEPKTSLILIRPDTVPDDVGVLLQVEGLLTAKGGATSHAAVTIPQLSKVGVVGLSKLKVYESESYAAIEGQTIKTGDFICIDGWSGALYLGKHERETEKYYSITL